MLVPLSDGGLHLCFSFVQVGESDFSPVLGLCNVATVFIVSCGYRFTLVLGCFLVVEVIGIVVELFWPC